MKHNNVIKKRVIINKTYFWNRHVFLKFQGVLLQLCFHFKQVFPKAFPEMLDVPLSAQLALPFQMISMIPTDTPYGGEQLHSEPWAILNC